MAWVSVLPSLVRATRPWFAPQRVGLTFPQVNLRTYVRYETRPGVYFFSLDAATALGVRTARALYGLPYYYADIEFDCREEVRRQDGGPNDDVVTCRFQSQRVRVDEQPVNFSAEYRPTGTPSRADPDSLGEFLAERYRNYVVRKGTVWCVRVEHNPWRLCPAEASVHADSLLEAAGLPLPQDDPIVRYSPGKSITVRTPFRP